MYKRLMAVDQNMQESVFIFGPRGVGKTFWLKKNFPNCLYFDLLNSKIYNDFLGNPSNLESRIPTNYNNWIVIDEIQKIPALLNEVHRLIEAKGFRFILTGSSARTLRKKGVNLLAGRALTFYMHPLTALELQDDFNLATAVKFGTLPKIYNTKNPKDYLQSYVKTYLKEEVQQEAITRNLSLFSRFLTVASFSNGQTVNYTNIAREIGSNRQTVTNFFEILEDLLIAIRLPVFKRRAKREMITQNKFYYFDAGVYRTLRPKGPLDSEEEIAGAGFETLFLQQLRAINDYLKLNYDIFYWRTRQQKEVDFVLYGENGLHAFEIKSKQNLVTTDFKGLKLFRKDYPVANCYMVYNGDRSYYEKDIEVLPFKLALQNLKEILKKSET